MGILKPFLLLVTVPELHLPLYRVSDLIAATTDSFDALTFL